jgi:hypothetical protein
VLGYEKIDGLRRLIRRHEDELNDFGQVFLRSEKNPSEAGGRPTMTYFLNEHHATALCLWAETKMAREARRLIVDVFTAWRRGEALPQPGSGDGITIPKDDYIALLQAQNALLKGALPEPRAPRKASVPLTDDERHAILRMCNEGLGVNEIARRTGRSSACISLLRAGFRLIDGGAA